MLGLMVAGSLSTLWQPVPSPAFFHEDVTGEQLNAELDALRQGRYPSWRLLGEAGYAASQSSGDSRPLCRFKKLWLEDGAGVALDVTLRCMPGQDLWRRIEPPAS